MVWRISDSDEYLLGTPVGSNNVSISVTATSIIIDFAWNCGTSTTAGVLVERMSGKSNTGGHDICTAVGDHTDSLLPHPNAWLVSDRPLERIPDATVNVCSQGRFLAGFSLVAVARCILFPCGRIHKDMEIIGIQIYVVIRTTKSSPAYANPITFWESARTYTLVD